MNYDIIDLCCIRKKEDYSMAIYEIDFLSFNERDQIQAWIYTPMGKPKGIVQVIHGFLEHSRRYTKLIFELTNAGYIVCADDHIGHGKTAKLNDTWGNFGDKSYITATEDEYTLAKITREKFGEDLPYFLFGHSWGSLIARDFTAKYGDILAGVVYCGTLIPFGNMPTMLGELEQRVAAGEAAVHDPAVIEKMFEGMTDRYEHAPTGSEWVAISEDVLADYAADPFNNLTIPPSVGALHDLIELTVAVNETAWAETVPKNLPIRLISGDQDPVGNYGEGVYKIANLLWQTGHKDVKTTLYPGYRHEIHNEPELFEDVTTNLVKFFDSIAVK